ncbi:MAG: NrdJb [Pseudomonadales bacterium]
MSIKIDKKIVGYSIKKDVDGSAKDAKEQAAAYDAPTRDLMHEEIVRPDELRGYTYKVKTPLSDHAMYITINDILLNEGTSHEQEYPFEVFINSKNMEHFQWILALTRVISAVFRKGGDATFLVEELKQVFDPQGGYFKKGGGFMPSLVADIGEVLEKHMKRIGLIHEEALSAEHQSMLAEKLAAAKAATAANADIAEASPYPPGAQLCVKCNVMATIMMDGCMTCLNCGESKCS